MTSEHHLPVTRTARYFLLGEPSERIRHVFFVLHGYGQLAKYFIRNFTSLQQPDVLVVAPEALSRFYLSGNGGRVGASWMTSDDRLKEIDDYTAYLDSLLKHLRPKLSPDCKVYILGFSQGVATAARWVAKCGFQCAGLVLWAGSFPPELLVPPVSESLIGAKIVLAAGRADEYLSEEKVTQQLTQLQQAGLAPDLHWYNGGHQLDTDLLQQLWQELRATS